MKLPIALAALLGLAACADPEACDRAAAALHSANAVVVSTEAAARVYTDAGRPVPSSLATRLADARLLLAAAGAAHTASCARAPVL